MQVISEFSGQYRWLSNFWITPIDFGEIVFPSAEHAYQAAKSEEPGVWRHIAMLPTPGHAKRAGQQMKLRSGWDDMKVDVMTEIIRLKFSDSLLKEKLIETGNAELIEGNTWGDSFWGFDMKRQMGLNLLGLILERRRAELNGWTDQATYLSGVIKARHEGFPVNLHG